MNKKITLSVKDLELWFDNDYGAVKILNKISFDIYKGETVAARARWQTARVPCQI